MTPILPNPFETVARELTDLPSVTLAAANGRNQSAAVVNSDAPASSPGVALVAAVSSSAAGAEFPPIPDFLKRAS